MGLPALLSIIYFIMTIILIFNRKKFGNVFIIYGGITFVYVTTYRYAATVPVNLQALMVFIFFSAMIALAGLTFGIITLMISVNKAKSSVITAILGSVTLILFIFNYKGYLTYIYIPVIMYGLQKKVIQIVEANKMKTAS